MTFINGHNYGFKTHLADHLIGLEIGQVWRATEMTDKQKKPLERKILAVDPMGYIVYRDQSNYQGRALGGGFQRWVRKWRACPVADAIG